MKGNLIFITQIEYLLKLFPNLIDLLQYGWIRSARVG